MNAKKETFLILILLLLCLLLFFLHLGDRPLWDRDEGEHSSTSKDMVLTGDWITPKLNGVNFYDKPILHYWFVAISLLMFGFTEFAARFPAAMLALGGVVATYLLGRRMFGVTGGFLSAVILGTSPEYVVLGRSVVHDSSLAFFMTLAFLFFYFGFKSERHRKLYFLLFYASLGFAVLAKGPVGVILPALVIGLFLLLDGKLGFLKKMEIGWGIFVFLIIAAPWYVLVSLRNSDYGAYFFIQNNVMRFLSPNALHRDSFYYYFPVLLGGFFPWSCFLPFVVLRALIGPLKKIKEDHLYLFLWFFVIFAFFSVAQSKVATYIFPLFPALSLLVGSVWIDLMESPTSLLRKGFIYSYILIFLIPVVGLLYLWIAPPIRLKTEFGVDVTGMNYLVLWMLGAVALAFSLLLRKRLMTSFLILVGAVVSIALFVDLVILPSVNPYLSTKDLAVKLDRSTPPGEKMVLCRTLEGGALFYTDRRILVLRTAAEVRNFLDSDKRLYCMIQRRDYDRLDYVREASTIIDQQGDKLIISNKK